jgi:hypothetical protein
MKPETIARRAAERKADIEARTNDLICRLRESAARNGPDSWAAECLAERDR